MKSFSILICFLAFVLFSSSCRKDDFYTGNSEVLAFEQDTLTFDTVFTTVGTVTRYFRVENTSKQDLRIEKIQLVEGENSVFKINVDGISVLGSSIEDIEILAEDYIYIFVEATLGENGLDNPLVIVNEIQYTYNGISQSSYLQAWGQDAYFHFGEIYESENIVWNNDKPHVIVANSDFPGLGVDSFSTLTIPPGTMVYSTINAGLYVDGILNVGQIGSQDSVSFQSARVEDLPNGLEFANTPGLWFGIVLFEGSEATFHNVSINQSTFGISARFPFGDFTTYGGTGADVLLDKVVIRYAAQSALFALNSRVRAENCLFYGAGGNLVVLGLGGDYEMDNCTFYNSGGNGLSHQDEVLAISNFASNGSGGAIADLVNASITNCIIDGTLSEELILSNSPQADFNYTFTNSLIKTEISIADSSNFINCIANEEPLFESEFDDNFRLTDNSPCIDAGIDNGITTDILFNIRNLSSIDIGAYEF